MIRIIVATCVVLTFLAAQARADWSTTQPSIKVASVPFVVFPSVSVSLFCRPDSDPVPDKVSTVLPL